MSSDVWTENTLAVLQTIVDMKLELPAESVVGLLLTQLDRHASKFSANLKFAALILSLITKHPQQVTSNEWNPSPMLASFIPSFLFHRSFLHIFKFFCVNNFLNYFLYFYNVLKFFKNKNIALPSSSSSSSSSSRTGCGAQGLLGTNHQQEHHIHEKNCSLQAGQTLTESFSE